MGATISKPRKNLPRVGIVGAGGFGFIHAKTLAALAEEGCCELVAACDPRLESLPQAWKEPLLDRVRLFRDHEQMFQECALDYIVIASPPSWHEEHCLRALRTDALIYLEKPPVPTFTQLRHLLAQPGAGRVAVGFQLLGAPAIRNLKRKRLAGELGRVHEIWATGLWPRTNSYYERAGWAGKTTFLGAPVLDGPLTNALAHVVQNVFFLAGDDMQACARPKTAAGCFARARPIESYDFGWIRGTLENGISYNVLAGHCCRTHVPWRVSIRSDTGIHSVGEEEMPPPEDLLRESHRPHLMALPESQRISSRLSDCLGYSMATSTAWFSSPGISDIPPSEFVVDQIEGDAVYHVESVYKLVENWRLGAISSAPPPSWVQWGPEADCRETLGYDG